MHCILLWVSQSHSSLFSFDAIRCLSRILKIWAFVPRCQGRECLGPISSNSQQKFWTAHLTSPLQTIEEKEVAVCMSLLELEVVVPWVPVHRRFYFLVMGRWWLSLALSVFYRFLRWQRCSVLMDLPLASPKICLESSKLCLLSVQLEFLTFWCDCIDHRAYFLFVWEFPVCLSASFWTFHLF